MGNDILSCNGFLLNCPIVSIKKNILLLDERVLVTGIHHNKKGQQKLAINTNLMPKNMKDNDIEDDIDIDLQQQNTIKENNKETTTSTHNTNASKNVTIRTDTNTTTTHNNKTKINNNSSKEEEEAKKSNYNKLKKQAKYIRLEADRMSIELTLQKISNLEDKYNKLLKMYQTNSSNTSSTNGLLEMKKNDILDQLNVLINAMNVTSQIKEDIITTSSSLSSSSSLPICEEDDDDDDDDDECYVKINNNNSNNNNKTSHDNKIELQKSIESFLELPIPIQIIIAKSVGLLNDTTSNIDDTNINATEIIMTLNKKNRLTFQYGDNNNNNTESNSANSGIITNLDSNIQEDIFNELFDTISYFEDDEFIEIDNYIRSILPDCTRDISSNIIPTDDDITTFMNDILFDKQCNFKPISGSKPVTIPGGVVINGDFIKSSSDEHNNNDENIEILDAFIQKKIKEIVAIRNDNDDNYNNNTQLLLTSSAATTTTDTNSLLNNIQYFYIKDPLPFTEKRFENGEELNKPVLLILGNDISNKKQLQFDNDSLKTKDLSNFISILGLCSIIYVCINDYYYITPVNVGAGGVGNSLVELDSISKCLAASMHSYSNIGLLLFGMGSIQFMHELGHSIIAWKDKFQIQKPIIIPSIIPQMSSIVGCITSFKTSPKNIKSFYDFSILGPIFGIVTSILLLVIGLQYTLLQSSSSNALAYNNMSYLLSNIPINLLKLSALGNEIITYFLGTDYLLVDRTFINNDINDISISLHPFALAGYIGIFMNALNLLPIGNTDGGRISQALFGRSVSRLIQLITIAILFLTNLFGYDSYNIFIYYVIVYIYLFQQNETDIPCKNEVDDIDNVRGLFAIFMGMIVALCLVPVN